MTTGCYIVKMEAAQFEHRVQKSMLSPLHVTRGDIRRGPSCSSISTALRPVPAFWSSPPPPFCPHTGCLFQKKDLFFLSFFISFICVSPQSVPPKDHHGTANSGPSARCDIVNPDPTLSIDGTKLALNPSMHRAVPRACQLAETKPFVGLLNPTDGEVDSK